MRTQTLLLVLVLLVTIMESTADSTGKMLLKYKGIQSLKVGKKTYKCAFNIAYTPTACIKKTATVKCKPNPKKLTLEFPQIEADDTTLDVTVFKNKIKTCKVASAIPAVTTTLPPPGPGLEERLEAMEAQITKLESCLADVDSDECPISQNGKTSVVDAITENTKAIEQFHTPQAQFNLVVTGGAGSNSVELITPEGVCSSSTIPPLPGSLFYIESVYHQGHLMVCGGLLGGPNQSSQSKCYLLKNSTAEWTEGPTMTKARYSFSMIQAGNVVYAIGGQDSSIEKLVGDQWELIPQTITTGANSQHCAVYLKSRNELVVIGGSTTNKVVALNLTNGEWKDLAPLPVTSVSSHRCSVIQDVIFVAGGFISTTYQKKVYRYEHEGGSWETVGDLTETRAIFGMDVMDNKLVVVGGRTTGGSILDGIESMDENEKWTKTSYSLPKPNYYHGMSAVPRKDFGCNN